MINSDFLNVLYIDLNKKRSYIAERKDLFKDYLGGAGVGAKLLDENIKYDKDPLDPEQPIIISAGTLNQIFPVVTKVCAVFRSPLTGEYGESHAGGRLGAAMRIAGVDAIVITGKTEDPVHISIFEDKVTFGSAEPVWGLSTWEVGRLIRKIEGGGASGRRSIMWIGPAGENLISYSCVIVDTFRHFGRLGLGALFGSKNIKAISISGDKHYPIKNFKAYNDLYSKIYNQVVNTNELRKYHEYGTAVNVIPLNKLSALPTRNLQQSRFEFADKVSGEAFAEKHLIRKVACAGCQVGCIHIGLFRKMFGDQAEYESVSLSYDYELIFSLGTFLGISEPSDILELIEKTELDGLDAIAAGVVLGWVTEAYQKGLITKDELALDTKDDGISFGETKKYIKILDNLTHLKNDFYKDLAKGLDYITSKRGGKEFAMTLGKNPMAGYHTGYASLLGQALVGARHSHVDNGGYSIDQKDPNLSEEKIIEQLLDEQILREMLNCTGICMFARKIYSKEVIRDALSSIGIEKTLDELDELGNRIYKLKLDIKKKLGFNFKDPGIPERFYQTTSPAGILDKSKVEKMVEIFNIKIDNN